MKVKVNENCQGCTLCTVTCPEVFQMNDNGVAEAVSEEVPAGQEAAVEEAANSCPAAAIVTE